MRSLNSDSKFMFITKFMFILHDLSGIAVTGWIRKRLKVKAEKLMSLKTRLDKHYSKAVVLNWG